MKLPDNVEKILCTGYVKTPIGQGSVVGYDPVNDMVTVTHPRRFMNIATRMNVSTSFTCAVKLVDCESIKPYETEKKITRPKSTA